MFVAGNNAGSLRGQRYLKNPVIAWVLAYGGNPLRRMRKQGRGQEFVEQCFERRLKLLRLFLNMRIPDNPEELIYSLGRETEDDLPGIGQNQKPLQGFAPEQH